MNPSKEQNMAVTCPHCRMKERLRTIEVRGHDVKAHKACRDGKCFHVAGSRVPSHTVRRMVKHRPGASSEKWFKPKRHMTYKGEAWGAGEVESRRHHILKGRARVVSYATVSRELLNLVKVSTDRKTIERAWEDYRWLRNLHEEGKVG